MDFKNLRSLWKSVYPPDKHNGIICPLCGNGSGSSGTGISEWKEGYLSCFKCGFHGDIVDLVKADLNVGYSDAVNFILQKVSNVEVESSDFSAFEGSSAEIYCKSRGLSAGTCKKFGLKFAEKWTHPKAPTSPYSSRLIIPTSQSSYVAYALSGEIDEKYRRQKVGKNHFFNFSALNQNEPVFVVEGEIDALSVEEVGCHAVSLGGVNNIKNFVDEVKKLEKVPILLLALDNDVAGKNAESELKRLLDAENISCYLSDINLGEKDANDALVKNREEFSEKVHLFAEKPNVEEVRKIEQAADFFDTSSILGEICTEREVYSTGFRHLDRILDGGLYSGLYILGAISSLGKTTFCLQVMDNVAKQDKDVIFFSLEMGKEELIAKALSRISMSLSLEKVKNVSRAITTREILKGGLGKDKEKMSMIEDAFKVRNEYSRHVYTKIGTGNIGVKEIREIVENHISVTGRKPVIFVDYLQMLALNEHLSDKQNVDKAVLELKRISRDFDIPVVGISSFNRENYNTTVNLTSFKESGAIEYSSDVLIGLQYDYMAVQGNETNPQRMERIYREQQNNFEKSSEGKPVSIELKVLKNRNGAKGSAYFQFWEKFNTFAEK